jgi:hypothetical protein
VWRLHLFGFKHSADHWVEKGEQLHLSYLDGRVLWDGASPIRHRLASPQQHELWLTLRSARSGISSPALGEGREQRMGLESEATYAGCNSSPFTTP